MAYPMLKAFVFGKLAVTFQERALRGAIATWLCTDEPDILDAGFDDAALAAIDAGREPTIAEAHRAVVMVRWLEYSLDGDAIENTAEALESLGRRPVRMAQRLRLDRESVQERAERYIVEDNIFPACLQLLRRRGGRWRAMDGLHGVEDAPA